jgi:hypothetical protein
MDTSVNVPNLMEVLGSPMLLDPLAQTLGLNNGALQQRVAITQSGRDTDVLDVNLLWDNPDKGPLQLCSGEIGPVPQHGRDVG